MMLDKASHLAGQEGMSGYGHFGSLSIALTNLQPGDVVSGRFQAAGNLQEPPSIRNGSQPNLDNPSLRFSSHVILDCVKLTSHLWSACVFCSACFWVTSYTPGILFIHGKLHQCVLLGQQLENSIDYWYPVYIHVISKTPKNVIHTPLPISHACLCRIKLANMIPCSHRPRFKVLPGSNRVWRPYTGSPFLSWRQLQVTSLRDTRPKRLLILFKKQRDENPHDHLLRTQISFKSLWETHLRSSQCAMLCLLSL